MNYSKFKNKDLKKYLYFLAGGAIATFGTYILYKLFSNKSLASKSTKLKLFTLKQEEAAKRSSIISDIKYNLFLQLSPKYDEKQLFEGAISIEFNLTSNESNIFLDYAGKVKNITINGESVGVAYEGERLYLKKNYLLVGNNKVNIRFDSYYSNYHKGLTYFHDSLDSRSYVYADCEPCYTHLIFPCFNQPSLKANIKLTVSTFEDWTVLSSGLNEKFNLNTENSSFNNEENNLNTTNNNNHKNSFKSLASNVLVKKTDIDNFIKELGSKLNLPVLNKGFILHSFKEAENIPIGTFSIAAGHFTKVATSENSNVYLRASSVNKNADYKFISDTVNRVFTWLKTNLSSPINNEKLDIIFVPSLSSESTSCLNCLLLSEDLLGPDCGYFINKSVDTNSYDKINLFAHLASVTAQRWFGIDVTPEWWDDTWFSKGFCIFFAFHILKQLSETYPEEYSDFDHSWLLFSAKKSLAVKEDSFSKTHPVKDSVLTSYQSIELLDAVTFFKSANIIRNLYSVAGPELFLKGLRNMLIKYSGKNINYEQFIEIYSGLAKERDMLENPSDLLSSFILNHGINELNVNFELEEEKNENNEVVASNKIKRCVIQQRRPDSNSNTYYNYKTKVYIIHNDNTEEILNINIKNEEFSYITELEGKQKPKLVLLNKEDNCYFRQIFSTEEINFLLLNADVS